MFVDYGNGADPVFLDQLNQALEGRQGASDVNRAGHHVCNRSPASKAYHATTRSATSTGDLAIAMVMSIGLAFHSVAIVHRAERPLLQGPSGPPVED